jgi:hypothetical protein
VSLSVVPAGEKNGKGKKSVAAYRAEQKENKLTVYAEGENNTGGWKNSLQAVKPDAQPPEFKFTQVRPTGIVTQAFVRFSVKDTIDVPATVDEVIVQDAVGKHKVPVKQVR